MAINPVIQSKNTPRKPARHEVREKIQAMILSGKKKPGERLGQQQLAKQFGVAQGVIREALLELQINGLVETSDNKGIFVGQINEQKLIDAVQVRQMLEALAVRLCCNRMTREQIRSMEQLAHTIYQFAKKGNREQAGTHDRLFHQQLIRFSQNAVLERLSHNFWVLGKTVRMDRNPDFVLKHHLKILKAIEHGDEDLAEQIIRQHIQSMLDEIQKLSKEGTFTPKWIIK